MGRLGVARVGGQTGHFYPKPRVDLMVTSIFGLIMGGTNGTNGTFVPVCPWAVRGTNGTHPFRGVPNVPLSRIPNRKEEEQTNGPDQQQRE